MGAVLVCVLLVEFAFLASGACVPNVGNNKTKYDVDDGS